MIRHLFILIWNRKRQNALMILEIFLAFLILFAVLTFVYHSMSRYSKPLGFDTEDIWIAMINVPRGTDSLSIVSTKEQLKQAITSFPEIQAASFSNSVTPFGGSVWSTSSDDNGFELSTNMVRADEDYDDLYNLNLIEGKWPTKADYEGKYDPIVVSKKLKETYFKDTSIIGRVLVINGEKQVLGVVDHFKYRGEFEEEDNMTFFSLPIHSIDGTTLQMRIKPGTSPEFEETVNQTIKRIAKDWDFVITNLENRRIRQSRETWIPIVALLSICGFLVINVALGLFGILLYNIRKRRSEIGLRRAVGASPAGIISQFMLEILILSTLGIIAGLFFAAQLPIMKLFEVANPIYLWAMLSSAGVIYTLVILCTLYPSSQASMIHPAVALHEE
ncbi:MAG: FtsX-like permease family protein [Bacteroidota bacterium]